MSKPSEQISHFVLDSQARIHETLRKTTLGLIASMVEELSIQEACPDNRRQRIFDKVMANVLIADRGHDTECWLWQGGTSGKGRGGDYARMTLDGATVAVHIAMWVNENGLIPPRKQLDHKCRQRLCVRPSHTELVTHKENQRRRDEANGVVRKPKRRKTTKQ